MLIAFLFTLISMQSSYLSQCQEAIYYSCELYTEYHRVCLCVFAHDDEEALQSLHNRTKWLWLFLKLQATGACIQSLSGPREHATLMTFSCLQLFVCSSHSVHPAPEGFKLGASPPRGGCGGCAGRERRGKRCGVRGKSKVHIGVLKTHLTELTNAVSSWNCSGGLWHAAHRNNHILYTH